MPITLQPLSTAHLDDAVSLYESAFPEDERRDTAAWRALCEGGGGRFSPYEIQTADGCPAGILTAWRLDGFLYIEHFAVRSALRGGGLGAEALGLFTARAAAERLPVVLEVEPAGSTPMADRRIAFYRRQGFSTLSPSYLQPAYRPGGRPLPLTLMCTDEGFGHGRFADIVRSIHHHVYGLDRA